MFYLMFQYEVIGKISINGRENAWIYGTYELYKNGKKFEKLFQAITGEYKFDETDYDEEWLNDENWFMSDTQKRFGITIPAIYPDNQLISFRLR